MQRNNRLVKNSEPINWLIFKTDISTKNQVQSLSLVLKTHPDTLTWTIDLEDCDHVFRIASTTQLKEYQVLDLLQKHGFQIEPLLD